MGIRPMLQYCNVGVYVAIFLIKLQLILHLILCFFLTDHINKLQFATYIGRMYTQEEAWRLRQASAHGRTFGHLDTCPF